MDRAYRLRSHHRGRQGGKNKETPAVRYGQRFQGALSWRLFASAHII
jgi:hypothetical protein